MGISNEPLNAPCSLKGRLRDYYGSFLRFSRVTQQDNFVSGCCLEQCFCCHVRNIFQRSIFSRFRGMPSVSPLVFTTRLTLVSPPKLSSVPGTAGWHDRLSASLPGGSLRNPRQWQPGLPFEGLEKQGENSPQQDGERESFGFLNMALWFGLVVP